MTETAPEWITLTEASRLLGVHPMTLRAWVDAGLVRAFRTPGGHRRFQVGELRDFLNQRRADNQTQALTVTPDQTLQHVRAQLGSESMKHSSWYLRLSEGQRMKQRELGQRLLGLLLQFVSRRENAEHFLAEGRALAHEYGRELAHANLSASELARAFLFFRRTIVNAAYHPQGAGAMGDAEGIRLLQSINTFMDELLISTLDAFDQVSQMRVPIHRAQSAHPKLQKSRTKLHKSRKK